MNILFLVMNFLLIFALLNGLVIKNAHFFSFQKQLVCEYTEAKMKLESRFETYKYKAYAKKSIHPSSKLPQPPMKKSLQKPFSSPRMKHRISATGKWNLSLLPTQQKTSTFLFEATEKLLEELYGHTSFWQEAKTEHPNLAGSLLEAFASASSPLRSFSDAFPSSQDLQPIFYKMLKGSGNYDIKTQKGYPPLDDFFTLQPKSSHLFEFPHAPHAILSSIFTQAILDKILESEEAKAEKEGRFISLTKEELRSIALESFLRVRGRRFQDLEPLIGFSAKTSKLDHFSVSEKKIALDLPIPRSQ